MVLFTDKKILTLATPKNPQNDRLYAYLWTRKKDVIAKHLLTQLTFSHWWHQSASNKWLMITPVWYLLIMESGLVLHAICRSQASSSSFSKKFPRCTGRLRQSTFSQNFAKYWVISKILSKQTQQQICNNLVFRRPTTSNHIATLDCDVSLIIVIHVSCCYSFSDINISQGSVATYLGNVATCLKCCEIFYYCFARNLLISLSVNKCWKPVSIWQS